MGVGLRAVLGHRYGRVFVGVSLLSGIGGSLMMVASGVWVMSLTGSSSLAALTRLFVYAPSLAGPLLGTVVDRLPRRRLLIATSLAVSAALTSLLLVRSARDIWLFFPVLFGYGTGLVLLDAGESAILPAALPGELLGSVNGLRMSAQEGTKLVGPLIGAALFVWQGGRPVTLLAALMLAGVAGLYAMLRLEPGLRTTPGVSGAHGESVTPGTPSASGSTSIRGTLRDVMTGIRFLRADRELAALIVAGAVAIALSGLTDAAVFAVVAQDLHRPAAFVGVLASAQGAGAIVSGLVVGWLLRQRGVARTSAAGVTLFAVGCAVRCVPWWPASVAASLLAGVGLPWALVAAMTAVQRRTPEELLGRVSATASTVLFGPVALAIPAGSALVLLDHRVPLVLAAAIGLASVAMLLWRAQLWRVRRHRKGNGVVAAVTTAQVTVRPAAPADAPAIAYLIGEMGYDVPATEVEQRLAGLPGAQRVFVAEVAGAVTGWVHVSNVRHSLITPARVEVEGIAVRPDNRRTGVGAALMRAVEEWAGSLGLDLVHLRSASQRDGAHHFYRRLGYRAEKSQLTFVKSLELASVGASGVPAGLVAPGSEMGESR